MHETGSRGGSRIFGKRGGGHLRSTSKKRGAGGDPTLGPKLKSLHRGTEREGPDTLDDRLICPFHEADRSLVSRSPATTIKQRPLLRQFQATVKIWDPMSSAPPVHGVWRCFLTISSCEISARVAVSRYTSFELRYRPRPISESPYL